MLKNVKETICDSFEPSRINTPLVTLVVLTVFELSNITFRNGSPPSTMSIFLEVGAPKSQECNEEQKALREISLGSQKWVENSHGMGRSRKNNRCRIVERQNEKTLHHAFSCCVHTKYTKEDCKSRSTIKVHNMA